MSNPRPQIQLPTSFADVTPEWLSAFLSRTWPETEVISHAFRDRSDGTATRLSLDVTYAPGRDNGLPRHMFLKSLLASPIAMPSMYACEHAFYSTMRGELSIESPRCFGSVLDEQSSHFVLLMEDVSARGARMGVGTWPCTPDEVGMVLDTLADLHAHFWNSPRLDSEFPWLETHLIGGNADFFRTAARDVLTTEYRDSAYKKQFFDPEGAYPPERLWQALWRLQEISEAQVPTVLHGDPHVANTYVVPDVCGGLLDWQLMRKGCWAHDVTYAIVTSLNAEDRKASERALLERYFARMASHGVTMPAWDDAWLLHRQTVIWGVLMWMLTPTPLYDETRLSIMLERALAAVNDLDSFGALGID